MSHSVCLILLNKQPENEAEAQAAIEPLLDPFSEHLEVDPHMTPCHCVGSVARNEAKDIAAVAVGVENFGVLRKRFNDEIKPKLRVEIVAQHGEFRDLDWLGENDDDPTDEEKAAFDIFDKATEKAWKELTGPYNEAELAAREAHPLKDKADPMCGRYEGERKDWWPKTAKEGDLYEDGGDDDCRGTGEYRTTYNPLSKWDWYQIGGRWNGYLTGYDPRTDTRNFENCICCGGIGDRDGWVIYRRKADAPPIEEQTLRTIHEISAQASRVNLICNAAEAQSLSIIDLKPGVDILTADETEALAHSKTEDHFQEKRQKILDGLTLLPARDYHLTKEHFSCWGLDPDHYERKFSGEYERIPSPSLFPRDDDKPDERTDDERVEDARKWAEKMNGCNGCQGKGTSLKHPGSGHIQQVSNIMPVSELPLHTVEAWEKVRPFSIVTPDGKWHEKGHLGMWGFVSDESDDWPEASRQLMLDNIDKFAVVVDMHI